MNPRRTRQAIEIVFGLAPATLLLLPSLLAGAVGVILAIVAHPGPDAASAGLLGWVAAAVLGLGSLWSVVLGDQRRALRARLILSAGLLIGIAAVVRWALILRAGSYEPRTWLVWGALLLGPVVTALVRIAELWRRE